MLMLSSVFLFRLGDTFNKKIFLLYTINTFHTLYPLLE